MKLATFLIAVLLMVMLGIATASAQIGTNYGNPCLEQKHGPNTLKTKKHDSFRSTTRFNAHDKALGNGNQHPYKPKQTRKNKNRNKVFTHKKSGKKTHKHKDRGDK